MFNQFSPNVITSYILLVESKRATTIKEHTGKHKKAIQISTFKIHKTIITEIIINRYIKKYKCLYDIHSHYCLYL